MNLTYARGLAGNITGITDTVIPGNSQSFGYDSLYRVTSASGGYGTMAFTYDATGNRLTKTVGANTDAYAYAEGTSRLASIVGPNAEIFTHDNNGSITARGTTTLSYNQNGRLIQAVAGGQTTGYVVNGMGQRVIKIQPGSTTVYHYGRKGKLLAETDSTGTLIKEYIYLDKELVAVADSTGITQVHVNHRLEPVAATDSTGTVVWRSDSTPFGIATVNQDPDGNGVNFTLNPRLPGQYYDSETGHHYNYFRDYYPGIGRYLQADPIGLSGGINLYAYADGNPVMNEDPFGLFSWPHWLGKKIIGGKGKDLLDIDPFDADPTNDSDEQREMDRDTDGDGISDYWDPDDDNDGIPDETDPDPKTPWDKPDHEKGKRCY